MCDSTLDAGFLLAPRGIYWDRKTRLFAVMGEPIAGMLSDLKMPNVPAWRCLRCGLVLFSGPPSPRFASRPAAGFRYACPGCGGDVYSNELECPECGRSLLPPP